MRETVSDARTECDLYRAFFMSFFNYCYMEWTHTTVQHGPRKRMGISSDDYTLLDLIYHTQTSPKYGKDGWCEHPYSELADVIGIGKGGLFQMADRLTRKGLMEVDPANPKRKRATERFSLQAYHGAVEDEIGVLIIPSVQKVNAERSESERKRSESERKRSESERKRSESERKRSESERHNKEEKKVINIKEGESNAREIPPPVLENKTALQWGDNSEARLEKATTAVKEYFTQYPDKIPALCQQARNRCNERGFWDEIGEYLRHHADNFQIMQNPIKALTSGPSNFVSWLSKPWCRDKYAALQPDQQPKRRAVTHQLRPERERITPEQVEVLREKHNIR